MKTILGLFVLGCICMSAGYAQSPFYAIGVGTNHDHDSHQAIEEAQADAFQNAYKRCLEQHGRIYLEAIQVTEFENHGRCRNMNPHYGHCRYTSSAYFQCKIGNGTEKSIDLGRCYRTRAGTVCPR